MEKKKYNRGRIITFDRVPEDVLEIILDRQLKLKKKYGKAGVSVSTAITSIIRQIHREEVKQQAACVPLSEHNHQARV